MEKASDYESEDSRFEFLQGRNILSHTKRDLIPNNYCHYCLYQSRCLVAKWKRHLTTNLSIPGSSLGQVVILCLILRETLYLIFTAIIIYLKFVAFWRNGKGI